MDNSKLEDVEAHIMAGWEQDPRFAEKVDILDDRVSVDGVVYTMDYGDIKVIEDIVEVIMPENESL